MATSVLLNFSNGIDFTPTDPLINLVRIGAQLLSYDLLSVETFTKTDGERANQIRKKIATLRNMLEDRCLSSEDHGERIRLIILLDFLPWKFLTSAQTNNDDSFDAAFPSLKIELITSTIEEVFGKMNPLLRRFDYNVIYIDDKSNDERSLRYQQVAYHGYCPQGLSRLWLSADTIRLNHERDEILKSMKNPDANLTLTEKSVNSYYQRFQDKQKEVINHIVDILKRIDKNQVFIDTVNPLFEIGTIGEFEKTDFDDRLKTIIRNIVGLGSDRFRNCTFFVMPLRQSIAALQCKDGIALKSLIQLICTIDENQYQELFRPIDDNDFHKCFIMSEPDDSHFRTDALQQYLQDICAFGSQMGGQEWCHSEGRLTGMNWESSKDIQYYVYQPRTANAAGSHEAQNNAVDEEGLKKEKLFKNIRKIPFFFGEEPNDWHWYHQVMNTLHDCCKYEDDNDRPIVESLTRVSDSEFPKESVTTNYGELGRRIEKMAAADIVSTVNYDAYIQNRKKTVEELGEKAEELKKELVKLGIRSRFLIIAILSSIVFAICFAFHFIYTPSGQSPLWISCGLLAFVLCVIIGMIIAQVIIREKIQNIYQKIDSHFEDLRKLARDHLASVNKLVSAINQADANRKTLSEMKAKYNKWEKHNKKVENWINYTKAMKTLLDDALKYLNVTGHDPQEAKGRVTINEAILESKPSVVAQIWSQNNYKDMKPIINVANQAKENMVKEATSFLSLFKFTSIQR